MDRKLEKKTWTKKRIMYVSVAAFVILLILYAFVFSDQSSKLNVEKDKIIISTVEHIPFQEFIPVTGSVEPIKTFYLAVSEGGKVVKKYVEDGAFVNVGEPIVKLDNAGLTLQIMYSEANVFQQINNLRSTELQMEQNHLNMQGQLLEVKYQLLDQERSYLNNKKLFEKNLISKIEFDKSREQYELQKHKMELIEKAYNQDSLFKIQQITQLKQSVSQMQGNLNLSKAQLEDLTVKAPIKGQLSALTTEIGKSVSPGENLGQIDVIDSFKVRASIDEHYISRVIPGQKGEFTLGDKDYELEIKTVYPQVTDGRFQVDMHFVGKQPSGIRRGQSLHIRLNLSDQRQAVVVSRGGFYQSTGGQWVFVVDPSGKYAVKRNIKLGQQNAQVFEVLEGLNPGEKVVTSSYENFGNVEKLMLN